MRVFTLISKDGDAWSLAQRIGNEGHRALVYINNEEKRRVGNGIIEKSNEQRVLIDKDGQIDEEVLKGVLYPKPDCVIMDMVGEGFGDLADRLRKEGIPVIGGCSWADKIELDRPYGATVMKAVGINIPSTHKFTDYKEAIKFVEEKNLPFVYKPSGNQSTTTTYVAKGPDDLIGMLEYYSSIKEEFELQEKIEGIEISSELWFNGKEVIGVNHTMEEKPFLEGGRGPLAGCFSPDTEILTDKGWKLFTELNNDAVVATLNQVSNTIEYHKINFTIEEEGYNELHHYFAPSVDILVTPNHRLFGFKERYKDIPILEYSHNLFGRRSHFSIPMTDFNWERPSIKKVLFGAFEIDAELYMMLLGILLSEGSVRKDRNEVRISQRKVDTRIKIKQLLDVLPWKFYEDKDCFGCSDKRLHDDLLWLGYSQERYIPQDILNNYSKLQLEKLLKWLMLGDGHTKEGGQRIYYTSSKRMADCVQELFLKVGSRAYINHRERAYPGYKETTCYEVIEQRDSSMCIDKMKQEVVSYSGKVYCVNVENNTIYIRRNGKAIWCGNCMGSVVWTGNDNSRLYKEGIGRMVFALKKIDYRGPIDLNTIVTKDKLYGLEFTARFGYDALFILLEMFKGKISDLLYGVATGVTRDMNFRSDWGVGIDLCVPPYPLHYEPDLYKDVLIQGMDESNKRHLWLYDVYKVGDKYLCAGCGGDIGAVTARGDKVDGYFPVRDAKRRVLRTISNLIIPDLMWRRDIGDRVQEEYKQLVSWGWLI